MLPTSVSLGALSPLMRSTVLLTVLQADSMAVSKVPAMPATAQSLIPGLIPLMSGDLIHGTVAAKEGETSRQIAANGRK
jgi:hypothetical protein